MANNKVEFEKLERPNLAKHDSSVLDLAFAMDCTGSMSSYIIQARENIRKIVEDIVAKEKSDVQLALVEYRDHPPQDSSFVTRTNDFTPSVGRMKQWLEASNADGGGDCPEAVADALHDVLKLSWREESTKICVCISDAPPHGLGCGGDGFPNGCPSGLDPMTTVKQMAEKGITLYMVGCEPSIVPYKDFFMAIAYMTGGQYVPLGSARLLTQVIVGGAQEELTLEQWMEEVNAEVIAEAEAAGGEVDEDEMTSKVQARLASKGAKVKQLRRNNEVLAAPSVSSMKLVDCMSMGAVRENFKLSHDSSLAGSHRPEAYGGIHMPRSAPSPRGAMPLMGMAEAEAMPDDCYSAVEQSVDMTQAKRMVKKSMARNMIASKKS